MAPGPKKWLHADVKVEASAKPRSTARKKLKRISRASLSRPPNWLWECMTAYVLLTGINLLLFPQLPSFRDVDPHPYLLVIILLACRYGSSAGLVSGLTACILHFSWGSTDFEFRVFQDFDSVARNCVVFLLSGSFLGVIQNRVLAKISDLNRSLAERDKSLKHQENQNQILNAINEELEQKVFTEVQSFSSLREVSESLNHLAISDVCESIPKVVCEQLGAEHASVYLLEGDKLRLKSRRSISHRIKLLREEIEEDKSLVGLCFTTKKLQCIRDFISKEERPQHVRESVMCAPLFGNHGRFLGVINIESLPFIKITESSQNLLSLIASLGGKALATAISFEAQEERVIDDEEMGVFKANYFQVRLAEEFSRAQRSDRMFSIALVGLPPLPSQDRSSRKEELRLLIDYFRVALRDIGLICLYKDEIQLAILFLDQDPDRVLRLVARADTDLLQLLPDMVSREIIFGVTHFDLTSATWQEMLAKAEKSFESGSLGTSSDDLSNKTQFA